MAIVYTDVFKKESIQKLGLKDDSIQLTIRQPDKNENVQIENSLTLEFYLKELPFAQNELRLLLYGQRLANGDLSLSRGLKVYPDLCPDFTTKRPTELLAELAGRFGAPIIISRLTERFFFHQVIALDADAIKSSLDKDGNPISNFMSVAQTPGHDYLMEFLAKPNTKLNDDQSKQIVTSIEIALAYCIDVGEYAKWIISH
jgi:hypothetical protein